MPMTELLKYAGVLISAIAGILALLGDPRVDGKLTRTGKALFGSIVAGLIIAVVGDQLTERELGRNARIEREWSDILEEPLLDVEIGYFVMNGEVEISEMKRLSDSIQMSFVYNGQSPELRRPLGFQFAFPVDQKTDDLQEDVRLVVHNEYSKPTAASGKTEFYKPEELDGWICAIWSSKDEWTSASDFTNGLSGVMPWHKLDLPQIRNIRDLRDLAIGFQLSDDLRIKTRNGHDISVSITVNLSSKNFSFRLDPVMLGLTPHDDESSKPTKHYLNASIDGPKLLSFLRKQFFEAGGIKSEELSAGGKLTTATGTLISIKRIVKLRRS